MRNNPVNLPTKQKRTLFHCSLQSIDGDIFIGHLAAKYYIFNIVDKKRVPNDTSRKPILLPGTYAFVNLMLKYCNACMRSSFPHIVVLHSDSKHNRNKHTVVKFCFSEISVISLFKMINLSMLQLW